MRYYINFAVLFKSSCIIEDVSRRLREKVDETYSFNFQPYLICFYKYGSVYQLELIADICERIIFSEFLLTIDSLNRIVFYRNTLKTLPDYIVDLFEKTGRPMTIYEMYEVLNKQNPNLCKSASALRGSCQRIMGEKLIYFGRSSTYGLKEWENVNSNIKGGTIRDIAEEYLKGHESPKHIREITEYIITFRPKTNSNSILSNLKSENNSNFLFFENKFVGLTYKKYENLSLKKLSENSTNRVDWSTNLELCWKFIREHQRLPACSVSIEETRIYRFYYHQKKAYKLGKLNQIQLLKFQELENYIINQEFPNTDWFKGYYNYISNILNKETPITQESPEYKRANNWKRNQLKSKRVNTLTKKQIELLIKIKILNPDEENQPN